jgi:hypothetical protein
MRIKILRGVNVQTANGVSPASAGAVIEVTEKCGRVLISDGRAALAPEESAPAIKQEVREEPIKKKMMKR